ncbi:hypothetical protein [Miniphocaeibacter halophilus]|uniref:Uncharacterized protein n=1 Tax=Miniphocaeibacter halophilus TaxID=2931922 RepID=A0AC61MTR6_9FIRM|nr:hypothetical protein [Miniphocaeibacter halophilus]QQK08234.1 hypothetical protein JFY71_01465 [Miniphocaeibacter halophilus]
MESLLKRQTKEYFKYLLIISIIAVITTVVFSSIMFFIGDIKIGLNKEVIKIAIGGSLPLLKIYILFITVGLAIEYVVSVKLHLITGYSRKSIFNVNIVMILIMLLIGCLIIATISSFGFKFDDGNLIYHSMDLNIFFNSFVEIFLQLLFLTLTASFIAISFKKNIVLGFIVLIFGLLPLKFVGLIDIDTAVENMLSGRDVLLKEHIFYLVFSLVSLIGYKEVLRRF